MPGFSAVPTSGSYSMGDGSRAGGASSTPGGAPGSLPIGGTGREPGERRTLWLGDLETWMDEGYLRQMCSLMGWDIVAIKVRTGELFLSLSLYLSICLSLLCALLQREERA